MVHFRMSHGRDFSFLALGLGNIFGMGNDYWESVFFKTNVFIERSTRAFEWWSGVHGKCQEHGAIKSSMCHVGTFLIFGAWTWEHFRDGK